MGVGGGIVRFGRWCDGSKVSATLGVEWGRNAPPVVVGSVFGTNKVGRCVVVVMGHLPNEWYRMQVCCVLVLVLVRVPECGSTYCRTVPHTRPPLLLAPFP